MFRYRLQQFMYGRYGTDQLSLTMVVVGIIFNIVGTFFYRNYYVYTIFRLVSLVLIILAILRMLSRNLDKRRSENDKFMNIVSKFRSKHNHSSYQNGYSSYGYNYNYNTTNAKKVRYKEDKKTFKYLKCPECKANLRVPKGKGKLTITCPKCRHTFKGKS